MSNLKVELLNKARVLRAFNNSPSDLARAIQKALEQTGGETVGKVKKIISSGTMMYKAPVDTGSMMRGIQLSEKAPLKVVITPNMSATPYAMAVHQGTRKMRERPFLEITKNVEGKNIQSFFQRTIDNFVKELARKIG